MNNDRLDYIRNYYQAKKKIRVEVPAFISYQDNGTKVIRYFDGDRFGYQFNSKGVAYVEPEDIHLFMKHYPQWRYSHQEEDQK